MHLSEKYNSEGEQCAGIWENYVTFKFHELKNMLKMLSHIKSTYSNLNVEDLEIQKLKVKPKSFIYQEDTYRKNTDKNSCNK